MTEAEDWLASHGFAEAGEYDDDEDAERMERLLKADPTAALEQWEGFPLPFRWMFSDGSAVALWLDEWEWELRCEECGHYTPGATCPRCSPNPNSAFHLLD
jgi:hypothetical protein